MDDTTGGGRMQELLTWLEDEARRIIRESMRRMHNGIAAFPPQVGIGYDAFWLRDYEYTLEGSIDAYTDGELTDACRLFIRSMRDDGAGVDCVRFDGTPIYRPGYDSMGEHPVADGSQFTVGVAFHTWRRVQDARLLSEVLDPLIRTMTAVPRRPDDGLVFIDAERDWDRCPYGFTDTVRKSGAVLFSSLLYVQACRQLSAMLEAGGRNAESREWRTEALRVSASVRRVFWDPAIGLFRAATVRCREPDIWGSAFAVYLGIADEDQSLAVARFFCEQYDQIVQHGQIRHLPGGVYWESAGPPDEYQNGGYWATPTGWFACALDLVDPALADRTIADLVEHFKRYGACEWIRGERRQLPNYLASAALPLAGIRAIAARRSAATAMPHPPSRRNTD
jgi:glycogen debranching enzyme